MSGADHRQTSMSNVTEKGVWAVEERARAGLARVQTTLVSLHLSHSLLYTH